MTEPHDARLCGIPVVRALGDVPNISAAFIAPCDKIGSAVAVVISEKSRVGIKPERHDEHSAVRAALNKISYWIARRITSELIYLRKNAANKAAFFLQVNFEKSVINFSRQKR